MTLKSGPHDLTSEAWREYDFNGRIYRIEKPKKLWAGTTTHRVLDSEGVVHCIPTIGNAGCVLRWKGKDGHDVAF